MSSTPRVGASADGPTSSRDAYRTSAIPSPRRSGRRAPDCSDEACRSPRPFQPRKSARADRVRLSTNRAGYWAEPGKTDPKIGLLLSNRFFPASGRACALSGGGDRAVGRVVHSDTPLRHRATSARALRNEPSETRARPLQARASRIAPIDGTLQGTTLVLVKIASSRVKIDVVSAELQFGTHHGTVLPGSAL